MKVDHQEHQGATVERCCNARPIRTYVGDRSE